MKLVLFLCLMAVASAQFFGRQPPQRFRRPQNFRNQNRFRPQQASFRPQQNSFRQSAPQPSGGADDSNGGSEYHYSWRHTRGSKYTHSGAVQYCRGLGGGWGPVDIESSGENSYISGIISSQRQEYIWTGGHKTRSGWKWDKGGNFSPLNWSSTGGDGRPQPDNRERNENCLAILNNFYRDGVKWHDVSCHHTKPIICERRA